MAKRQQQPLSPVPRVPVLTGERRTSHCVPEKVVQQGDTIRAEGCVCVCAAIPPPHTVPYVFVCLCMCVCVHACVRTVCFCVCMQPIVLSPAHCPALPQPL